MTRKGRVIKEIEGGIKNPLPTILTLFMSVKINLAVYNL